MKILVTGATGFTGSHLTAGLLDEGHEVRALVRESSNFDSLRHLELEMVRGDIRDKAAVERAVKGIDAVYHLAACYRQAGIRDSVYRAVNVEGTRNVLEAALRHNVQRVIHCSTVGVHGHIARPPADESAPFNPGDPYQESKLEAEMLARQFHERHGLPVVIVRPTGIYGPGDLRFLKLFRAIRRRKFIMLGSGRTLYHMTYISDLIAGLKLCGNGDGILGECFIIGGEESVSLERLVGMIAAELGVEVSGRRLPLGPFYLLALACEKICVPLGIEPPLYRRRLDFFSKDRAFDISKAKTVLGYRPQVDLKRGLHLTAVWYREKGYL